MNALDGWIGSCCFLPISPSRRRGRLNKNKTLRSSTKECSAREIEQRATRANGVGGFHGEILRGFSAPTAR